MKIRGLFIILLLLLIGVVTAVGLTSINHPIILEWVTGSARHFGKPTDATVYTNGQANLRVNVFYSDEPDSYILSIPEDNSSGAIKFLSINVAEKWIGTQPDISADDYDFIAGHLFLSKKGERFFPFKGEETGVNFDPQFEVSDGKIKFTMSPRQSTWESVRITFE